MRALLSESWLTASLLLVVVGLTIESVPLLGLGALVLGAGGASRLWSRLSLEDVEYRRELSEHRAFVGERVSLTMHLKNDKVLPVPWLEVRERLPDDAPVIDGRTSPAGTPGFVYLTRTTALRSGDRLEWPLEMRTVTRGYQRMGPARLKSGDLFGLFEREEYHGGEDVLIVYPRTYPIGDLGLASSRPFGEHRGGSPIFPDPIRVVGVRDYIPGDPLKQIDWNATARAQRLQSRLYEPSREYALIVALDVMTLEHTWEGSDPVLLERAVVVAASIARDAFERKSAIGLISNGALPDADRPGPHRRRTPPGPARPRARGARGREPVRDAPAVGRARAPRPGALAGSHDRGGRGAHAARPLGDAPAADARGAHRPRREDLAGAVGAVARHDPGHGGRHAHGGAGGAGRAGGREPAVDAFARAGSEGRTVRVAA